MTCKKRMGATYVGVRRAHPYSWLLSSPQQPLETEDPPTVSLAPQYTSQRLCRARAFLLGTYDSTVCWERLKDEPIRDPLTAAESKTSCRFFAGLSVEIS